jgi:glycosyltransferase involved in cell wall biosynthesis
VVVVDSFSRDRTEEIAREHCARFFQRRFDDLAQQRNWGLNHTAPRHPWVLLLDADERVSPALRHELETRLPGVGDELAAFRLRRRFHVGGRWLRRSSLYPTWLVRVVRPERVRFFKQGHGEGAEVDGATAALHGHLVDENLKGFEAWVERHGRYALAEARAELERLDEPLHPAELWADDPEQRRLALKRLAARLPGRALGYFAYSYLWRGGLLEGREGLALCARRSLYQQMIASAKHDLRRRG